MYMHMYMYVHCMQQTSTGEWTVESMSGCNPSGYTVKCVHSSLLARSALSLKTAVFVKQQNAFSCAHICIPVIASATMGIYAS